MPYIYAVCPPAITKKLHAIIDLQSRTDTDHELIERERWINGHKVIIQGETFTFGGRLQTYWQHKKRRLRVKLQTTYGPIRFVGFPTEKRIREAYRNFDDPGEKLIGIPSTGEDDVAAVGEDDVAAVVPFQDGT